ncbi:YoaK family protein [Nakamurella endophytica]|uniref:DUF1275 domain-containing protein n=1 Tax=Nakamurella endophytica TaxID=1748367 RepID=A0A917SUH6_9ACTN|nr:DUF1275 family protein [Nakamurella endophytica]GGL96746.1 hypothetical protein GCM10011594_15620 [Nakamurella endophytica]
MTAAGTGAAPDVLSVPAGLLLLVGTGYVDAYTFLEHGGVFAEAMTGNLVLIAVGALRPEVVAFWRPLVAYLAFVAGVAALWLSATRPALRGRRHPQLATLLLEVVVLLAVGALPGDAPDVPVILAIAFVSGLQIAAFRTVGQAAFTTTVMTTNSMRAVVAALEAVGARSAEARRRAVGQALPLVAFVAGAFAGAAASTGLGGRAAFPAAAVFAVTALLYVRQRRRPAP